MNNVVELSTEEIQLLLELFSQLSYKLDGAAKISPIVDKLKAALPKEEKNGLKTEDLKN